MPADTAASEAVIRTALAEAGDSGDDGGSDAIDTSETESSSDSGVGTEGDTSGGGGSEGDSADGGDQSGSTTADDTGSAEYAQHDGGADQPGAGDGAAAAAAKSAGDAEHAALVKELGELGIHAPKPGQKDNKMPYSRMVKIFGNAKKKWEATAATANQERDSRLNDAGERLRAYDNAEQLIMNDPDRYIRTLAVMHPDKYGKFVEGRTAAAATTRPAPATELKLDPIPGPNLQFPDGSVGYSPDQLEKRDQVIASNAAKQARHDVQKEMDQRFGPLERDYKTQALIAQHLPQIQNRMSVMQEQYGDLFTKDEALGEKSAVLTYMRRNKASLEIACAKILGPKQREREKGAEQRGREAMLKEIKERKTPAEVSGGAPKKPAEVTGPRSTEQVIRDSMRAARMI